MGSLALPATALASTGGYGSISRAETDSAGEASPRTIAAVGPVFGIAPPPGRSAEESPRTGGAEGSTSGTAVVEEPKTAPPVLVRKKNVLPFWVNQTYDTHTIKALTLPPLFVHREGNEENPDKFFHFDLSLTTGWYDAKKEKRRFIAPLGLFAGSWDDHKVSWGGLLPTPMGYKRIGEKYNFGSFPFIWAWGNRHQKNVLVVPFHFQSKTPRSLTAISSFLFWYGNADLNDDDLGNDRKHFVAFPLYWSFKKGLKSLSASPLYFAGRNDETGAVHRTFLPLFHWQSREFGNRKELWTPFWIKRSDRARRKSAWALPALASFGTKNGPKQLAMMTPLLWHAQNTRLNRDSWIVGPFGLHRDSTQRISWAAPLWVRFADKASDGSTRASASVLFPLFYARQNAEKRSVHTLLGYAGRSTAGSGRDDWSLGLHPLLTYAGRNDGRAHSVIAGGLFWRTKNQTEDSSGWGIGPLAYRTASPDRKRFGVPALLTFSDRQGDRATQVFTPLLWHRKDPAKQRNLWVFGPGYVDTRAGAPGYAAGLAPLVFAGKSDKGSHVVVPPLLTWDRRDASSGTRETISPFFVRTTGPGRATTGVLGLGWDVRRAGERHTVVAPVYYRRRIADRTWTFTPIGGAHRSADGKGWAYGPVWKFANAAKQRSGGGFAPLVWHFERDSESERGATTVVPGMYIRDRRPERDLDMWSPLVWRSEIRTGIPRKGFAAVPFYFRSRQPGGTDVDAGLGFFYARNATRHTHTLVGGPFFHHKTRKELHTGLFPVTWWMDSETHRRLISLPLVFQDLDKKTGKMTTLAAPFWFDRRAQNGRRTWMAFPFVLGRRGQYNFTRLSVAPPGYFDIFRLQKDFRFTGFAPLLFRYQKCGFKLADDPKCAYTLWGSFPLFFHGKDGNGRRTHSALGLYWADKDPGGRKFFTLLGGGEFRPGERTRWYAGTVYRDVTATHATTAFLPLFYLKKHRRLNRRTLVVAPPLFIQQRRDDRKWFEAGLLVWQFRTPAKVTTVVLPPLFGLQHSFAERKLSWLAPIYLRDKNQGKDETWTAVFPLLTLDHKKAERRQFIQFPLVWHFGRKDGHGTVGFPLWWDFENRDRRFQTVPGIWARRVRGEEKTNVIGPFLAHWKKSTDEKHWRILLGLFGGGTVKGQRYVQVFGRPVKVGKPKAETAVEVTTAAKRKAKRDTRRAARAALKKSKAGKRVAAR